MQTTLDASLHPSQLWAPHAWLVDGWHDRVLLSIGTDGCWSHIDTGVAEPPPSALQLPGPVLPGLVNAHSHAFQRAIVGMAERRQGGSDNFWSWRDHMYHVAQRITAEQLEAIATQLYLELLHGGYTQVCEFHYLQHTPDGSPYPDPLALTWALADAAQRTGMGLTLLPVLYERAGFTQPALRDDQRRFALDARGVLAAQQAVAHSGRRGVNAGVAVHSLRAATPASIRLLKSLADTQDGAIHIHVAEQWAEVDDCLAATGMRPLDWLARQGLLDRRWHLVHATHSTLDEIDRVAGSDAGVVLCPSTEANLGDGLCDLPGWLAAGVPLSLGSDSHVTRCWPEELRWLEYGQRLQRQQRNVAAAPAQGQPATADHLWQRMQAGSAAAAGLARWGLVEGARADLLVLDAQDPRWLGLPSSHTLDALVFSSPGAGFNDVMVAGQWALRGGIPCRHTATTTAGPEFKSAMAALWAQA